MIGTEQLLALARAYAEAEQIPLTTLSSRMFNDGKVFMRLEAGKDITLGRFRSAIQWLSEHWPDRAEWPADVPRPEPVEASA